MDYFKKFFGISEQKKIFLVKQETFDRELDACYEVCPRAIFEFLKKTRELERKHSKEVWSVLFTDSPKIYKRNLEEMDKLNTFQSYSRHGICEELIQKTKEIETSLEKK